MKLTKLSKTKSHPKSVVDFESNLENGKSNKSFYSKKWQSDNYTKDCLKPRSNKIEGECKKCGGDYFYVPNY